MPYTNPFFSSQTGISGEQELINDLVIEQIKMFGLDLLYMPRKNLNYDKLLNESTKSAFELALPIPMMVKSFDGYDQSMELLTKFGVRGNDSLTLIMSRSEWSAAYEPFIEDLYEDQNNGEPLDHLKGQTAARPKEGDLIFFPFDDSIFEIKYTEFEQPFFQLGRGYVYEITCERFEYSGETFSTGYEDVDDTQDAVDYYKLEFDLQDGGSGTFTQRERVKIYDVSGVDTPGLTPPDPVDTFRFYNDSGFLEDVDVVEATVQYWDLPNKILKVGDITNIDPDQEDTNYDVTVNKFAASLIVGQESGASWLSTSAEDATIAFKQNKEIQNEFDSIKVVDPFDKNPFGFE